MQDGTLEGLYASYHICFVTSAPPSNNSLMASAPTCWLLGDVIFGVLIHAAATGCQRAVSCSFRYTDVWDLALSPVNTWWGTQIRSFFYFFFFLPHRPAHIPPLPRLLWAIRDMSVFYPRNDFIMTAPLLLQRRCRVLSARLLTDTDGRAARSGADRVEGRSRMCEGARPVTWDCLQE